MLENNYFLVFCYVGDEVVWVVEIIELYEIEKEVTVV